LAQQQKAAGGNILIENAHGLQWCFIQWSMETALSLSLSTAMDRERCLSAILTPQCIIIIVIISSLVL